MPLLVNLRHLDAHNILLEGELAVAELDLDTRDEVIQASGPLAYCLEVQEVEEGVLVQGRLRLELACECVRCLKRFSIVLELKNWACHAALSGEESAAVVNDCVDLTPYVREDILLELPQHPLCDPGCSGLPRSWLDHPKTTQEKGSVGSESSAWGALNNLKFDV
jgi:uncharacterized metal-binding protein YceD (DUF177 family)